MLAAFVHDVLCAMPDNVQLSVGASHEDHETEKSKTDKTKTDKVKKSGKQGREEAKSTA
jgi:hypothetical protein